jgi:hypothetical protein
MEDLPCFWEIQLVDHFAYSFEYGKWVAILKGEFSTFPQS